MPRAQKQIPVSRSIANATPRARGHGDLREQHKCRSEDNQEVVAQNQMLFQARIAARL